MSFVTERGKITKNILPQSISNSSQSNKTKWRRFCIKNKTQKVQKPLKKLSMQLSPMGLICRLLMHFILFFEGLMQKLHLQLSTPDEIMHYTIAHWFCSFLIPFYFFYTSSFISRHIRWNKINKLEWNTLRIARTVLKMVG